MIGEDVISRLTIAFGQGYVRKTVGLSAIHCPDPWVFLALPRRAPAGSEASCSFLDGVSAHLVQIVPGLASANYLNSRRQLHLLLLSSDRC